MYKIWVRSHADLPLKFYQIVNTFRYETKHTRPLIRLREITSFKEAHTVHRHLEDAEAQVKGSRQALYRDIPQAWCPCAQVKKTPTGISSRAQITPDALDAVMPDGEDPSDRYGSPSGR